MYAQACDRDSVSCYSLYGPPLTTQMNRPGILVLCCTLAYSGSSCAVIRQGQEDAELRSREASLHIRLAQLREVINQYTVDQGRPPRNLEDIVSVGYINNIPEDPVTEKADWFLGLYHCAAASPCKDGIKNVHSASKDQSTRGDLYSDW